MDNPIEINWKTIKGERIAFFRGSLKLAQAELGEKAGISKANISRLEKGLRGMPDESEVKICDALGIDRMLLVADPRLNKEDLLLLNNVTHALLKNTKKGDPVRAIWEKE